MLKRKVIIPIGPSIAYVQLTQGQFALIDNDDAERVGAHNWCAQWSPTKKAFYAVSRVACERIELQRWLLGLSYGDKVQGDHRNGNSLDNRRSNLRRASRAQNQHNRGKTRRNKSGYKGVYWYPTRQLWLAKIGVGGRFVHIGYFPADQKEAAAAAYAEAAMRFHGEFARVI